MITPAQEAIKGDMRRRGVAVVIKQQVVRYDLFFKAGLWLSLRAGVLR